MAVVIIIHSDLWFIQFAAWTGCSHFTSVSEVFILSMTWMFAQLTRACCGSASPLPGLGAETTLRCQMVMMLGTIPDSNPSFPEPVPRLSLSRSPGMPTRTCESLSMPVQTSTKRRSLAVIRIDWLVLCLPIYIMDLSHSMMCFCQVLPH